MVARRLDARAAIALLAVAAIWATVLAMYATTHAPAVATAGAFDLTITAGVAMYLIAVRGGHLPRRALWLVVAAGALAARILLARSAAHVALAAAATIELAVIAVAIVRIRRAARAWRAARTRDVPRIDALDAALAATGLPAAVAGGLATELAVVGYALAGWRAPRHAGFTVHRTNGWALYAGVFVVLTLVETPVLHIALAGFGHPTAAWLATALSLYGALWLVGDLHALRHGGVVVTRDALELRLGVRWRGRIARTAIARVERGTASSKQVDFSILGANVVVHLYEPCMLRGLLGRRRTVTEVALSVDEPERFVDALTSWA